MEANQQYLSGFGEVLLFIVVGILFLAVTFFLSSLIRPRRPNAEKLSSYESGEEALSTAWTQFNVRFYVIALIFLLFEIEIVLLFPWATVFADRHLNDASEGQWGWLAVAEAVAFILVLALGLAYAWVNGHLDWVKPVPDPTEYHSPVPPSLYDDVNSKYNKSGSKNIERP